MKLKFRTWYVWLFPAAALVLCGILAYRAFDHGPRIKIAFPDAEGISPDRTTVKFRGVPVGVVEEITLSDTGTIATVVLDKRYKSYAVEGTKFWLVEPQVSFQGVTGLSTLRDGNYIAVSPGDPGQPTAKEFVAGSSPQKAVMEGSYRSFTLTTPHLGALGSGDPVYFRGLQIGQVISVGLNDDASTALLRIGINSRYTPLVKTSAIFWRKNAIQADLSLFGGEINVGSLESVLKGGVEMGIRDTKSPRANAGAVFALQEKAPDVKRAKPLPPVETRTSSM